jgi:hypothetical protein
MTDFHTIMASYEHHRQARKKANTLNKAIVLDALAAADVTSITVAFDGEGDSGQIEDITAYTGETPRDLPETPITLHTAPWNSDELGLDEITLQDAVEALCYDYLEQDTRAGRTMTGPMANSGSMSPPAPFSWISTGASPIFSPPATNSKGGDHGTSVSPRPVQREAVGRHR